MIVMCLLGSPRSRRHVAGGDATPKHGDARGGDARIACGDAEMRGGDGHAARGCANRSRRRGDASRRPAHRTCGAWMRERIAEMRGADLRIEDAARRRGNESRRCESASRGPTHWRCEAETRERTAEMRDAEMLACEAGAIERITETQNGTCASEMRRRRTPYYLKRKERGSRK